MGLQMIRKVIKVLKPYTNVGYCALAGEMTEYYQNRLLPAQISFCKAAEKAGDACKWTDPAWIFLQSMQHASEECFAEGESLIKKGQIGIQGFPFDVHTEFLGPEELNRMFCYARTAHLAYGVALPSAASMTDVFAYAFCMPGVLHQAGIRFLHICESEAWMPLELPDLFWWEGPDGTRILTFCEKKKNGGRPSADWEYPVWLLVEQRDNPYNERWSEEQDLREEKIRANMPDAKFIAGTLDDFYRELLCCDLTKLPVIKGDIADRWIAGVASYPAEVSQLRRNRIKTCALEILAAVEGKQFTELLNQIYENALLFAEHAWGLDVKLTLGYGRSYDKQSFLKERADFASYRRIEKSWEEQRGRAREAIRLAKDLYRQLEECLICEDETSITVFNQQAKGRTVYADVSGLLGDGFGLCDAGKPVRIVQSAEKKYAEIECKATQLKSLQIIKNEFRCGCSVIDREQSVGLVGQYLAVDIDKNTGAVSMLCDVLSGENYFKTSGYEYEVISSAAIADYIRSASGRLYDWSVNDFGRLNYPANFPGRKFLSGNVAKVEAVGDSVVCELETSPESFSEFGNAKKIQIVYTLMGKALNIRLELIGKQAAPCAEGGNIFFDLNMENARYTVNKVGSLLDPQKDIVSHSNHRMYCLENFVDITDGSKSLAIVSHDAPLCSFGESAVYKYSGEFERREGAKIFFNLFNNQWGTGCPQWTEGNFSYEFDLIPHSGGAADVMEEVSSRANRPLIFAGRSRNSKQGSIVVQGGELLTVFESRYGKVLRIRENQNRSGKIILSGNMLQGQLYRADLFGCPVEPCEKEIETRPMQIHSVLIKDK